MPFDENGNFVPFTEEQELEILEAGRRVRSLTDEQLTERADLIATGEGEPGSLFRGMELITQEQNRRRRGRDFRDDPTGFQGDIPVSNDPFTVDGQDVSLSAPQPVPGAQEGFVETNRLRQAELDERAGGPSRRVLPGGGERLGFLGADEFNPDFIQRRTQQLSNERANQRRSEEIARESAVDNRTNLTFLAAGTAPEYRQAASKIAAGRDFTSADLDALREFSETSLDRISKASPLAKAVREARTLVQEKDTEIAESSQYVDREMLDKVPASMTEYREMLTNVVYGEDSEVPIELSDIVYAQKLEEDPPESIARLAQQRAAAGVSEEAALSRAAALRDQSEEADEEQRQDRLMRKYFATLRKDGQSPEEIEIRRANINSRAGGDFEDFQDWVAEQEADTPTRARGTAKRQNAISAVNRGEVDFADFDQTEFLISIGGATQDSVDLVNRVSDMERPSTEGAGLSFTADDRAAAVRRVLQATTEGTSADEALSTFIDGLQDADGGMNFEGAGREAFEFEVLSAAAEQIEEDAESAGVREAGTRFASQGRRINAALDSIYAFNATAGEQIGWADSIVNAKLADGGEIDTRKEAADFLLGELSDIIAGDEDLSREMGEAVEGWRSRTPSKDPRFVAINAALTRANAMLNAGVSRFDERASLAQAELEKKRAERELKVQQNREDQIQRAQTEREVQSAVNTERFAENFSEGWVIVPEPHIYRGKKGHERIRALRKRIPGGDQLVNIRDLSAHNQITALRDSKDFVTRLIATSGGPVITPEDRARIIKVYDDAIAKVEADGKREQEQFRRENAGARLLADEQQDEIEQETASDAGEVQLRGAGQLTDQEKAVIKALEEEPNNPLAQDTRDRLVKQKVDPALIPQPTQGD